MLDYFQDCSTFHSEDIGVGVDYLIENQMVWVMSYWQIVVERYPKIGEWITIGTAPYDFKGFLGFRNFLMTDEMGNRLAYANSIWSLLNTQSNRPVKSTDEMLKAYVLEPKLEMDYEPRKIAVPTETKKGEEIQIKKHHLDTNHHVNNGQFVRIAMEALDSREQISQLRVEYKKQVLLGDMLIPYTAVTEGGRDVIELKDKDGDICCVVELQRER